MGGLHSFDPFGDILSGLAKRLGLESRLVELRVQRRWRDIVGEPMASHTWPAQIRFKKLYLLVRNSVWLQQLTFLKPALLTKLQAECGPELITDIASRVGEIPSETPASPVNPVGDRSLPQLEESWAEVCSRTVDIQDPALRDRLREVISRYPVPFPPRPAKGPSQAP